MNNFHEILIIGRSKHFESVIKSVWPNSNVKSISWRGLGGGGETFSPNLLIICGYDYSSYYHAFDDFVNVNVDIPVRFIEGAIMAGDPKLLYIMTQFPAHDFTFSRYVYAKNMLALKLFHQFPQLKILSIPSLVDLDGAMLGYGVPNKLLFNFLKFIGAVKTININQLTSRLINFEKIEVSQVKYCKPMWLAMPRSMFVDRFLRLTLG